MNVPADLGPVLPTRAMVHMQARELAVLAARAVEFSGAGATANLAQALRQLDSMRAVLGGVDQDHGPQARKAEWPPAAQASWLAGSEESPAGGCPRPAFEGKESA